MALHQHLSCWQKVLLGIFCFPLLPFYLCYMCCAEEEEEEELEATGQQLVGKKKSIVWGRNNRVHAQDDAGSEMSKEASQPTQGSVTCEMQPKYTTPEIFRKFSFGKGKQNFSVRVQDKRAYPWDGSSLKSMEIDLKNFEHLDAYASKVDVKSSVEELVRVLLLEAHTDLEKVRAIWMWVCHHIEYHTAGYYNVFARSGDPNVILQKRKGVCAGYAALFERMCSVAGIRCVQILGYAKGHSYRTGQSFWWGSDHAWNAVHLDGRWHLLDSTWGAGNVNDKCTRFHFVYNEFYFLTHPAILIEDHFPHKRDWQLLSPPLSKRQYGRNTRRHNGFFSMGLLTSCPQTAVIKTVSGKAVISIEGCSQMLFMFNINGTEKSGLLTLKRFGMQLEVYPRVTGRHTLHIFAKPFNSSDSYSSVLEYIVACTSVDKNIQIPEKLDFPVGPSWLSETKGFLQPSHPDPVIHSLDGRCCVSFALKEDLDIFATMHSGDRTKEVDRRHIFKRQWENRVELKIQLPQAGSYVLCIFAKSKSDLDTDYCNVCNYLLSCTNAQVKWPVFPLSCASWLECYELWEPTGGVLPANSIVHFKLQVPGMRSVFIQDNGDGTLTRSDDGYWEGSFNTAGCRDVTVMAQENLNRDCVHLLRYQVEM